MRLRLIQQMKLFARVKRKISLYRHFFSLLSSLQRQFQSIKKVAPENIKAFEIDAININKVQSQLIVMLDKILQKQISILPNFDNLNSSTIVYKFKGETDDITQKISQGSFHTLIELISAHNQLVSALLNEINSQCKQYCIDDEFHITSNIDELLLISFSSMSEQAALNFILVKKQCG